MDWQDSYIVSLYNFKDDLNRGKYRSVGACNLIELVIKVLKSVMKGPTSQRVEIDQIYVYDVTANAISYWDSTVY